MNGVFISWTIENWITVVLMASLGYLLAVLVSQAFMRNGSGSQATPPVLGLMS
jgi:hypothetical protein